MTTGKDAEFMALMYGSGDRTGRDAFITATEVYTSARTFRGSYADLERRVFHYVERSCDPRNNYGKYAGRITKWKA